MVKLALVGLGYWGPNFARILSEHPQADLVWCCDLSPESLKEIAVKYKNVKTTTKIEDVLQDEGVDALIVAVPAAGHFTVTKKALLAGKDVLVEKPLAISTKEAKALIKIAKAKKLILMVDHIFLFNPGIVKLKQLLDQGELGKIYYGYATYTALGPIRIDVSAMWDLAIHFLYTVSYLLGTYPTGISAFGKAYLTRDNADVGFLNMQFGKKIIFNLKVSWLDPVKTRLLVLVGDRKMVTFDDSQQDKVVIYDRGVSQVSNPGQLPSRYQFTLRYGDVTIPHIPSKEPLKEVVEHFLASLGSRKEPLVNPIDSVNSVILLEAAQHSLKHQGKFVSLSLNRGNGLLSYKK